MKDRPFNKKSNYARLLKIGLGLIVLVAIGYGLWLLLFSTDSIKTVPTKVYPDESPRPL